MSLASLPENTEGLLLYLLITPEHSKRSREMLGEMENFDEAVAWLTENGYAYEYEDCFELTLAGMHAARQVQNVHGPTTQAYPGNTLADNEPTPVALPTIESHPLRITRDRSLADNQIMRYMLAFDSPKNVLPVPVLDGDILGRFGEVNISLTQDEFISSQHCRFSIKLAAEHSMLCVEDLGSRNGTFVNKHRLEPGQIFPLSHGSRVQVGNTVLKVVKIPD